MCSVCSSAFVPNKRNPSWRSVANAGIANRPSTTKWVDGAKGVLSGGAVLSRMPSSTLRPWSLSNVTPRLICDSMLAPWARSSWMESRPSWSSSNAVNEDTGSDSTMYAPSPTMFKVPRCDTTQCAWAVDMAKTASRHVKTDARNHEFMLVTAGL